MRKQKAEQEKVRIKCCMFIFVKKLLKDKTSSINIGNKRNMNNNINFNDLPSEIKSLIFSYNKPRSIFDNVIADLNERFAKGDPRIVWDEESYEQEMDLGHGWTFIIENSENYGNPYYDEIMRLNWW